MKRETKVLILNHLKNIIQQKIEVAQKDIAITIEARNSDTKSSAGDKHETSRAMIQIDLENIQKQLNNNLNLRQELERINVDRTFKQVENGCLLQTNLGNYFIAIGLGRVELQQQTYFVISLDSPIGLKLKDKKVGDEISFQERMIKIEEIF
jgi:hypothetical protein